MRELISYEDPGGRLVLRHLTEGLSAPVPTAGFSAFWNALEGQAEEEASGSLLRVESTSL